MNINELTTRICILADSQGPQLLKRLPDNNNPSTRLIFLIAQCHLAKQDLIGDAAKIVRELEAEERQRLYGDR